MEHRVKMERKKLSKEQGSSERLISRNCYYVDKPDLVLPLFDDSETGVLRIPRQHMQKSEVIRAL